MHSFKTRYMAFTAIIALVFMSQLAYGAPPSKLAKVLYLSTFSGVEAWKPFGLLNVEEPAGKNAKAMPLLQLTDATGKTVAFASWDGDDVVVSEDGTEWSITLAATVGLKRLTYILKSSWSDKTKLSWGIAELTVLATGNLADAAKYRHVLRIPGTGSWVSKDGKNAVVSSPEGRTVKVFNHAALSAMDASCTFKSRQIEKADASKQQRKIFFVDATSSAPKAGEEPKSHIMGLYITVAKSWSYEPVMDLAAAMASGKPEPDVRIFGTADKQAASPGDSLEYTYYLLNVGMDEATDLNVTIPISENTGLIAASINGSPGKAKLMPSGEEVEVSTQRSDSKSADRGVLSFQWRPKNNLMPGEMIYISFSVII